MSPLLVIRQAIAKAQHSPLAAKHVTLLGVSKTQSTDSIELLIQQELHDFGENQVQEALHKWPDICLRHANITLHMIGHLQTNKVKAAIQLFDVIHTVDRLALAESLRLEMTRQHREIPCFIQVNTGEEPQKRGVFPADTPAFIHDCRTLGLPITGLMCVPPANQPPAPHFALLRKLATEASLLHLSMGMSGDFETAIRMGATHVRIGTALFGKREG